MVGQLADYEVTGTVLDDGTISCLKASKPARLGTDGGPVTIWALGPVARSPWPVARARTEAAAAVHDPNLPDWLEAGAAEWGGRPVIWVSAATDVTGSLSDPPVELDIPGRLRALAAAARGAHALHEGGVLHGAICPQAVALRAPGHDDGPAVLAPPALADGSRLAVQVGYPPLSFVDPQLLRGEGGRWSDIWALGATLHQVVTGRPAYPGLEDLPVVQAVSKMLTAPPVALANVPPAASDLVSACLSIDPAARPASAAEVARRLDEVASQWQL